MSQDYQRSPIKYDSIVPMFDSLRESIQNKLGKTITCKDCGILCERTGVAQRYCHACSTERSRIRKRKFERDNPEKTLRCKLAYQKGAIDRSKEAGVWVNKLNLWTVDDLFPDTEGFAWTKKIEFPYSKAISKNHIFRYSDEGHLALRAESRQLQADLAEMIKAAIADVATVQNKVWLDLLIQKPDHRSDAINMIDLVCDAVKVGIGIDDRWFCFQRLDWQIAKEDAQIFLGIGQKSDKDVQACSKCGRLVELEGFWKNPFAKAGVVRVCRLCFSLTRKKNSDFEEVYTRGDYP